MAVEYETTSDIATIKGVASNTQVAQIVKFYTGAVTFEDEAGSKYGTVTIDGKKQRVMLCISVSGTATYDDVPCKYSTVSGHRCLNVVEPTGTETPDDVYSLHETITVSGKNVRAIRCVLINKTPTYYGMSNDCTFTDDDGKIHTAQLVNVIDADYEIVTVRGQPLSLPDAVADELYYVKAFGLCEQFVEPSPDSPTGILCNNGGLGIDNDGNIIVSGNHETIKDSKNNTVTCDILLGLESYRDEQEILTGTRIRRIGIAVLDGTEDWEVKNNWYEADVLPNGDSEYTGMLCTHFPFGTPTVANTVHKMYGETKLQINYPTATTVDELKTWLAGQYANGTPVMVVYVLKNPTTESVSPQVLEVKSGANTIQITDASLSDLILEAQYKKTA